MLRQISTLVRCSMPLDQALKAVAEQSDPKKVAPLLLAVRSRIQEGMRFSDALACFPQHIPKLYCATIEAGEASGKLDHILEDLAIYTEKQNKLKQKVQQAMIYPIMMVLVSVGVVLFLLGHVVPTIISVFSDMHQNLPNVTRILIALSNAIQHEGWLMLVGVLALMALARWLYQKERVRLKVQSTLLRLPLLGKTIKTLNAARFARTLGILQSAGVPLIESLHASNKTMKLLPMRRAVAQATQEVIEGQSLGSALKKSALFSPMMLHLIVSGEMSGNLAPLLLQAANQQEDEVEHVIQSCLTLFEPVMILVMGGVVLFIVLAILLPIFDLDQFAGQ